jgi:hypothetical protein
MFRRWVIFSLPGISGVIGVTEIYIWRVFSLPGLLKLTESTRIVRRMALGTEIR